MTKNPTATTTTTASPSMSDGFAPPTTDNSTLSEVIRDPFCPPGLTAIQAAHWYLDRVEAFENSGKGLLITCGLWEVPK